jgi:hypothetical protein
MSFKTYSTAYSTPPIDTLRQVPSIDSLRNLLPAGFFVLSERGARKSIKARIDADAFFQKWQLADMALGKMTATVSVITMERNIAQDANARHAIVITDLKKKLKKANIIKYTALISVAVLATKLIFHP